METNDKLGLQNDKEIEKLIPFDEEPMMYSEKIMKISRWHRKQDRVLILTVRNIYIFNRKQLRKKMAIDDLGCIIKSLQSNEFILNFPNSFDLRIMMESGDRKDDFLNLLKLRYAHLQPKYTLRIYGVPGTSLKDYHTTPNKKKYNIQNTPTEDLRMYDEEIKSAIEFEKDSFASTNMSNQTIELDQESDMFFNSKSRTINKADIKVNTINSEDNNDIRESVLIASKNQQQIKLDDFFFKIVLGRGTFGKVFLAELTSSGKLYAVKSIRKDVLLEFDQVNNTKLEKDILMSCEHPFLVSMDFLFQSQLRLYFVMPFVRGGELYKVFQSKKRFPEVVVKFYATQIAMAIGYLHNQGIAHRDLKLENILIDQTGYLKIIDYGLAKMLAEDELSMSFCGTPEYLAPEMVAHIGHDKNVDWWALGILIYEMLIGVTPFYNRNRNMLLMKIKNSKVIFPDKNKYKIEYSDEIQDVITQLLNKDKTKRLGYNGDGDEVLKHAFFKNQNLEKILKYEVTPPFIPDFTTDELDTKYFNTKKDLKDLADTYIPEAKVRKVQKFNEQFKDF